MKKIRIAKISKFGEMLIYFDQKVAGRRPLAELKVDTAQGELQDTSL